jgi:outer membrane protein assembly factor BamD
MRLGNTQLGRNRESQARQYFEKVLEENADSDMKAQAQMKVAESLYRQGNYLEARFEYQKFLELYPLHQQASRAQFQIGMCSLQDVNTFDRDQRRTMEALQAFRTFRQKYPQDVLMSLAEGHIQALRHRLAEHEFAIARFYYDKGAYQAAIGRFLNLIQVYPDMAKLDAAMYMLAGSYRSEENYAKTRSVLQVLADRFTTSTYGIRARAELAKLPAVGL